MFAASRVIAVDDDEPYLKALCQALHASGIPCVPLLYPDQQPPEDGGWFRNVRIMFCDLHLIRGAARPEQSYGAIGAMLERIIQDGSPLLLVLWTNYSTEAGALKRYLEERYPKEKQPSAILALQKSDFDGPNAGTLPAAIRERLSTNAQLSALLEWENDIANAADDCVRSLFRLASASGDGAFTANMDVLLSQLACAAGGKVRASNNPGVAIHEALMPLLSDSVLHLPDDAARIDRWKLALPSAVAGTTPRAAAANQARINTALNVVHAGVSPISGRERGSAIVVPEEEFDRLFAISDDEKSKQFALDAATASKRWLALQIEAVCDYAQRKSVLIPYVLALEVPSGTRLKSGSSRPDAVWVSPPFLSESGADVILVANVRFVMLLKAAEADAAAAVYRLREQITNDLAFVKARHELRPGYISLR